MFFRISNPQELNIKKAIPGKRMALKYFLISV
jgi:hypothetical protein